MDAVSKAGSSPEWETINGLMENAIYGGRVDNPFDFRVLKAYLSSIFSVDILTGRKELYGTARLPSSNTYEDYEKVVAGLADHDSPSLFGLPDNIERSVQRTNSAKVMKLLKTL